MNSENILNRLQTILQEYNQGSKFLKLFQLVEPTIKLTSELKSKKEFLTQKRLMIFKKSKTTIALNFLFIGLSCYALFIGLTQKKELDLFIGLLLYNFILALILTVLWQFFYSNEYNFSIYIDIEGIQIDTTLFKWEEIEATAILNYSGKGDGTNKLVI